MARNSDLDDSTVDNPADCPLVAAAHDDGTAEPRIEQEVLDRVHEEAGSVDLNRQRNTTLVIKTPSILATAEVDPDDATPTGAVTIARRFETHDNRLVVDDPDAGVEFVRGLANAADAGRLREIQRRLDRRHDDREAALTVGERNPGLACSSRARW